MRNMPFSLTTEQVRNRTKTVTRRLGWKHAKVGERIQACVKCMGLKPGEKIEKLCVIEIVSVGREPLMAITEDEIVKEGFPGMSKVRFVGMFCAEMSVSPGWEVTRMEFKYVE